MSEPAAAITRSVEDLRGFHKVDLEPGKTGRATYRISPDDLKFYISKPGYVWEPGEIIARIADNSIQLHSAWARCGR